MGKVEENKQQKLDALYESAYELFIDKGLEKTSIHDIVQKAGVAKGTFYLYFKDKYEIRDKLIARTAATLFNAACNALKETTITELEDKIIFIVDYVLEEMKDNKPVVRFISKNLSWGVFRHAITKQNEEENVDLLGIFYDIVKESPDITLRAPETMLFIIIELASSTSYSTILEDDPISYDELRPYLNESVRAIIRNHIVSSHQGSDK